MKILFFIETLRSGGKERRFTELLIYLKQYTNYQIRLVLMDSIIHYDYILKLDIHIDIIERKYLRKDPSIFYRFYKIVKKYDPDIIHTWGAMTTFYAIPSKFFLRKPLLGNLIADAKNIYGNFSFVNLLFQCSFKFVDTIFSNSKAGILEYGLINSKKIQLIYNGVNLNRFDIQIDKDEIKDQLNIQTHFVVIMVASTSIRKDYDLFLNVAKETAKYFNDVTFIGVGGGSELERLKKRIDDENIMNIQLIGRQTEVEKIISISDIGVLFTYSEGISNSIIEYMASSKPVITTDKHGGSCEIIEQGKTGYIIENNVELLTHKIIELLENTSLRNILGYNGRKVIQERFNINIMGKEYVSFYEAK